MAGPTGSRQCFLSSPYTRSEGTTEQCAEKVTHHHHHQHQPHGGPAKAKNERYCKQFIDERAHQMAPTSCKGSTPCQIIVPSVCTTPTQAIQLSHNADTRTNHAVPPFSFRVLCGIFFLFCPRLHSSAIYSLFSQPSSCFS